MNSENEEVAVNWMVAIWWNVTIVVMKGNARRMVRTMSDKPFKIKFCVKCKDAFWCGPDYSAGIMGPCLDDCRADACPMGNRWEDYENDKIDWEGEDSEWD
jgi:hypothetical protein